MSDDNTTTPEPDTTPETPAQEPDWKRHARTWEERAKASNAELEELRKRAAKLDELEEAQKTAEQKQAEELEQLRTRAAELEQTLARKDRDILAQRIAADKGVPVKYLTGDTEEEIVASADEFLNDVQTIAPPKPSGYVPSQGTGDPTPPTSSLDEVRERANKRFPRKS